MNTISLSDQVPLDAKILWIVSSGGHLAEASVLERQVGLNAKSVWMTNENVQARTMLEGRRVKFVPYVKPRDLMGATRSMVQALALVREESFDAVVSTGAAIAGLALPALALAGQKCIYVESLARTLDWSVTGRLMQLAPAVRTFSQHSHTATASSPLITSVLDKWSSISCETQPESDSLKIFVTLGTIRPYRFDRALDAVLSCLQPKDEVVWQVGSTTREDFPGQVFADLPYEDMCREIEYADVVVCHAGVGTLIDSFRLGKRPVMVVRSEKFAEHVDDHQEGISALLEEKGLASRLPLGNPTRQHLLAAKDFKVTMVN